MRMDHLGVINIHSDFKLLKIQGDKKVNYYQPVLYQMMPVKLIFLLR